MCRGEILEPERFPELRCPSSLKVVAVPRHNAGLIFPAVTARISLVVAAAAAAGAAVALFCEEPVRQGEGLPIVLFQKGSFGLAQ